MNPEEIPTQRLYDYKTGEYLRPATDAEVAESFADTPGNTGVILADDVICYVEDDNQAGQA